MEPVTDSVKRAILASSLEIWLLDNVRGFSEVSLFPGSGGRSVTIEGKIALDDLAEYVLRRVRKVEDAKL